MKTIPPLAKHLVIAYRNWIESNNSKTHILVDVSESENVRVPMEHVNNNNIIVLNISGSAIRDLCFDDSDITFEGRFNGIPQLVRIPYECVQAVYDAKTCEGLTLSENIERISTVGINVVSTKSSRSSAKTKQALPKDVTLVLPKSKRDRSHLKLVVDNTKPAS